MVLNKNNEKIKLTQVDEFDFSDRYIFDGDTVSAYRLNLPIEEVVRLTHISNNVDFDEMLMSLGARSPYVILASRKDVEDYKNIRDMFPEFGEYKGPSGMEDYYNFLFELLRHLEYCDFPFEKDGKWGLKCTTGDIVVPPIFDACRGSLDILMVDTLAVVEKDGKLWLTSRDDSGLLVTEQGYDYLSRSFCYAWVRNNYKYGFLDSQNGKVLIPCEMDWMLGTPQSGYFVGKGDKVGKADSYFGGMDEAQDYRLHAPIFDAVNLTTGQFCLNGKWGWLTKDEVITTKTPKNFRECVYVDSSIPLDDEGENIYWRILNKSTSEIPGVSRIKNRRFDLKPLNRLQVPSLMDSQISVPILEDVENAFKDVYEGDMPISFIIENDYCGPINVNLNFIDKKWKISVSWESASPDDMAVDKTFPLINACNVLLLSNPDYPYLKNIIKMESESLELAKKFISVLIIHKERNEVVISEKLAEL